MDAISVTVKIESGLKRARKKGLSVYLNSSRVGDVFADDVLQFSTTDATNLVQVGWINKKPFKWLDSAYSFDASKADSALNLEVTVVDMKIVIKRI